MNISLLQPQANSSISVGHTTPFLTFLNMLGQNCIPVCLVQTIDKCVISTPGYTKESTHNRNGIILSMTINHMILYARPHILPVNCRKSRNSLFSIRNCSISDCFLGLPFGFGVIPCARFRSFRLFRLIQFFTCSSSKLNSSAISRLVRPSSRIAVI